MRIKHTSYNSPVTDTMQLQSRVKSAIIETSTDCPNSNLNDDYVHRLRSCTQLKDLINSVKDPLSLEYYGIPPEIADSYAREGITKLYPWQR